jgi:hypothetical protein
MSNPRITYTPHPDASLESELDVLANIYAYLIRTHDKRAPEPAQPCAGDTTSATRRNEAEMT